METLRQHAWRDLDVLVAAEFDALEQARPARRRELRESERSYEPRARPARDETTIAADSFPDSFPDSFDEPFDEPSADDEEAFIERTAAWLQGRPDAEALLEAVRAALAEPAPAPGEAPAAPAAGEAPGLGADRAA